MKKLLILLILLGPLVSFAQTDEEEDVKISESEAVYEMFEVSIQAEYYGGEPELYTYIGMNIEYPSQALQDSISGIVLLMFVVDTSGLVTDVSTINSKIGYGLEEEAMRVIKSTSGLWTPAMLNGNLVKMKFRLPVKFMLD